MSKVAPLHNEKHSQIKVSTSSDYSRFKAQHLIPAVAQDFATLATEFPIVFVKNSETGQFISVAMMGIKEGINLYCQDKSWSSPVTPLGFANAPLSLAKQSESGDELVVCIDEESPLTSNTQGEALFNGDGEQSDYLKQRSQALLNIAEFTQQTQAIAQFFANKGLIVQRQLSVKILDQDEPFVINGLYLIDEKALNDLPSKEFDEIRSKGLLPLIYAHLTSLHQIKRLAIKQNQFDQK